MTATPQQQPTPAAEPARRRPGRPRCERPRPGAVRKLFRRELHALRRAGFTEVDDQVRVDDEARLWRRGLEVRGLEAVHGLLIEEAARAREVLERVWRTGR